VTSLATWTGEVVRDWNDIARSQPFGNPLRLARILAIMHAAQHDAVNGAQPRYQTYVSTLHNPHADAEAAAAVAAHEVLVAFFPANQLTLDDRLTESLSTVPDGHAEDAGVVLGRAVADLILDARADDGYSTVDPLNPTPGPRVWEPTPPAFAPMLEAQFHNVTPFTLRDRAQFLPDPPPSLTSERYAARHFNEVKLVGQDTSPVRTPDQTHLAHFWAEPSPSGWSRIGNLVSARYGYDLHDTARLQALLNMAMADGFIVGWYQKRLFAFWRPVTAIRKADTDGNPSTQRCDVATRAPDAGAPRLPVDPQRARRRGHGDPAAVHRERRIHVLHGLDNGHAGRDPAVLDLVHPSRARERRVASAGRLPLPVRHRNRRQSRPQDRQVRDAARAPAAHEVLHRPPPTPRSPRRRARDRGPEQPDRCRPHPADQRCRRPKLGHPIAGEVRPPPHRIRAR
jgi:hypothetical protein